MEYDAAAAGPPSLQNRDRSWAERNIPGFLALCLAGQNCQVAVLRTSRWFELNLRPVESESFAQPQTSVQQHCGNIGEGIWKCAEICCFAIAAAQIYQKYRRRLI